MFLSVLDAHFSCLEQVKDSRTVFLRPIFRAFYDHVVPDGKAEKLALIPFMRKLIILINHLLKNLKFKLA